MNKNSVVGASSGRGFANFKYRAAGANSKFGQAEDLMLPNSDSMALQPSSQTTQISKGFLSGLLGPQIAGASCQPVKAQVTGQAIQQAVSICKNGTNHARRGVLTKTVVKPVRKRHGSHEN